jgi:plasmid stabilization system protein ParE
VIRFRPAAAREFAADFRYYEKDRPGRGVRFVAAVDVTLRQIEAAPLRFTLLYEPDIRSAKVKRFPYRVVYVVVQDAIDVIAVAHAKRRPGYWRRRLP